MKADKIQQIGATIDQAVHQTPMYFDMTTNKTVNLKGVKTVSVRSTGAEKRRLTVVLAATRDGQMLTSMIIFKGKRAILCRCNCTEVH